MASNRFVRQWPPSQLGERIPRAHHRHPEQGRSSPGRAHRLALHRAAGEIVDVDTRECIGVAALLAAISEIDVASEIY